MLIEKVKEDHDKRQAIMDHILVYQATNGRWCISDREVHKFLPPTMGDWDTRVRWDFRWGMQNN